MRHRLSPITAVVCALATCVVSLVFGSETYLREVVAERRGTGNLAVLARSLAAPNYSRFLAGQDTGAVDRYGFLVVLTVAVGLLVLATVRGANGFVAGWTAAVAAGGLAGLVRGLMLADTYYGGAPPGAASLNVGLQSAGTGATYGLLIGWGVGVIALLGGLLARSTVRSTPAAVPTPPAPSGGHPTDPRPAPPFGAVPPAPPSPPPVAADAPVSPPGSASPWSADPASPVAGAGSGWAAPPEGERGADAPTRVVPPVGPDDRPAAET